MVGANLSVEITIQELSERWRRSREAAFEKIFSARKNESEYLPSLNLLESEKFEEFLKLVFLNSRNLGLSYQKNKCLTWERSDFVCFAEHLGSPCLVGHWERKPSAHMLRREGCTFGRKLGSRYCQFWREAIDGLVVGISDEVGFVRNRSIAVGDDSCIDVFYNEEASPTDAIWLNSNRWGALPDDLKVDLGAIELKFQDMKIDLKFLGLSEKELLYKMEAKENLTCGSAGVLYRTHLEKLVREKFPNFNLKDASPIAVYGERT